MCNRLRAQKEFLSSGRDLFFANWHQTRETNQFTGQSRSSRRFIRFLSRGKRHWRKAKLGEETIYIRLRTCPEVERGILCRLPTWRSEGKRFHRLQTQKKSLRGKSFFPVSVAARTRKTSPKRHRGIRRNFRQKNMKSAEYLLTRVHNAERELCGDRRDGGIDKRLKKMGVVTKEGFRRSRGLRECREGLR